MDFKRILEMGEDKRSERFGLQSAHVREEPVGSGEEAFPEHEELALVADGRLQITAHLAVVPQPQHHSRQQECRFLGLWELAQDHPGCCKSTRSTMKRFCLRKRCRIVDCLPPHLRHAHALFVSHLTEKAPRRANSQHSCPQRANAQA